MEEFDSLKLKFLLLFWILFPSSSDAQIPNLGRCSNKFKAMKEFDKLSFMGRWYEVERFYLMRDVVAKCVQVNYERFDDGRIYVNNVYTNRLTNRRETLSGKFKLTNSYGEKRGEFLVKYDTIPPLLQRFVPNFLSFLNFNTTVKVLHTDYDNFAILFSCRNINSYSHAESSWLMTREQQPSEEIYQMAYGYLDKFGLRNFFIRSDQTRCDP